MYNCIDCGREHSSFTRSDGEALCEDCANEKYVPCVKCGRFIDPDEIHKNEKCNICNQK